MPFMQTMKNMLGKIFPVASADAAGRVIQPNDEFALSPEDVPGIFDIDPTITLLNPMMKRIPGIRLSHYEVARFSRKTLKLDPRLSEAEKILIGKSVEDNERKQPFDIGLDEEWSNEYWDVLDEWARRINLYAMIREAADYGCAEGEVYYRVRFNTNTSPFDVHSLERIPGPSDGFELRGPILSADEYNGMFYLVEMMTGKIVAKYRGFEVIPFKREASEHGLGDPILATAIRYNPHLNEMEDVMPVMRKYRSGVARVFKYPPMGADQLKTMITFQKKIEREKGTQKAFADVHTTAEVSALGLVSQPLDKIDDVRFFLYSCLAAVGTPLWLLSTMPDVVPARGDTADVIYDNWIRGRVKQIESMITGTLPNQLWLGENHLGGMGILKLIGIKLMLMGIEPRVIGLKLEWPNKLPLTASEIEVNNSMYDRGVMSNTEYARRMGNLDFEEQLELQASDKEKTQEYLGDFDLDGKENGKEGGEANKNGAVKKNGSAQGDEGKEGVVETAQRVIEIERRRNGKSKGKKPFYVHT